MKSLVRVLGVSFVFLFMVLLVGKAGTKPVEAQDPLKDAVVVFDPPESRWVEFKPDWNARLYINRLIGDMLKPIAHLQSGNPLTPDAIPLIAAVYGANGNFTGHDGRTYKGICEISLYFYRLIGQYHVTDFSIQVKAVYAKEFTERAKMKDIPDDVVLHSFYFILASSFKLDGKPVDPLGSTNCCHIKICECSKGI
jgi:hypothetical protein